jgi:hypothetical protein
LDSQPYRDLVHRHADQYAHLNGFFYPHYDLYFNANGHALADLHLFLHSNPDTLRYPDMDPNLNPR